MKLYLVFLGALVLGNSITSHAQLFANNKDGGAFPATIKKVVEAAAKNYAPIRGEVLFQNPQTTEYTSLVIPEGAVDTKVIEYSASKGEVYSWQSVLLRTEEYTEAEKKYRTVYNQLKGMNVVYVVDNYTLTGKFDAPTESKKFSTSVLTLANPPIALKKLRIEVTLQFEFPEWTVFVNIYDKEKDDSEDGSGMN
jgi:hypothetical protein